MDRKKASCTTLLVGKKASIDGSTMIARNEDSGSGSEPQNSSSSLQNGKETNFTPF